MLTIKHIKKIYKIGNIETIALNDMSLSFREKEFVAILGVSGSGKTTALNIIGGLDRYDSGDLIIKGKHTKDFSDSDWDAYRNNSVGFVFQSYNLINHLSIVENVELGMTLSGVETKVKNRKARDVLERVGLKEHLHKKPNQLSGGQQQRVAIARALANDPEILLCDEPTGALDTETSTQILDLIKEIANDRLVIMVTHNPELADQYSDRLIEFKDGKVISDTHPFEVGEEKDMFSLKKTSMSFSTALKLSFNNILTKKGRTILTSFASSIGIIGIAVILSLSTGFKTQIDKFQSDALSEFPIMISEQSMNIDANFIKNQQNQNSAEEEYAKTDYVTAYNPLDDRRVHQNVINKEFIDYIEKISPNEASSIGYTYLLNLNLVREEAGKVKMVDISGTQEGFQQGVNTFPVLLDPNASTYIENSYELLAGAEPFEPTDMVLVLDSKNRVNLTLLKNLGFDVEKDSEINFNDIVGKTLTWLPNDAYYEKTEFGNYVPRNDMNLNASGAKTLKISGIIRQKEGSSIAILNTGLIYSDSLSRLILDDSMNSEIAKAQLSVDYNILSLKTFKDENEKQIVEALIGASDKPSLLTVYPKNFESKDAVLSYLDAYNTNRKESEQIFYTDLAETLSSLTKGIMDGITVVLVAFAGISLIVSLIMIGIITYTSVIERTKEIGVLRALGARKKDITRVFDAETFILGVFSGTLGVGLAYLLTFPINLLIFKMTDLANVANLRFDYAFILVIISTVLTILGGHIPAKMASKKDAVEALRSE